MLFATTTLAARVERAECQIAVAFGEIARRRGRDVLLWPIGGATAVFAGTGQPFNKLAGLGFGPAVDDDALDALEAQYDERKAELRVELATLADNTTAHLLTSRGYRLAGYENVLGLELTADVVKGLDVDGPADAVVTPIDPGGIGEWIHTVAEGFSYADSFDGPPPTETFEREVIERVFADVSEVQGMSMYIARRAGVVAGGGALRFSDGLALLSGASTLPAHRRKGVQSILLKARLVDAARRGCDLAIVTTEPASKSQQNVQRIGFTLLYARAVLIRQPGTTRRSE